MEQEELQERERLREQVRLADEKKKQDSLLAEQLAKALEDRRKQAARRLYYIDASF